MITSTLPAPKTDEHIPGYAPSSRTSLLSGTAAAYRPAQQSHSLLQVSLCSLKTFLKNITEGDVVEEKRKRAFSFPCVGVLAPPYCMKQCAAQNGGAGCRAHASLPLARNVCTDREEI